METDGRDTNRAGSSGVDNVVPFPRDWIGPLDDLVPIGTSTEGSPEEEDIADAFAADAFWSEGSASLHQVIEAPAPSSAVDESSGALVEVHGFERHRAATLSIRPRPVHAGRFRRAALGAGAAFVIAAVAVGLEVGSPAPAVSHHAVLADGALLREAGGAGSSAPNESLRLSRLLVARAIERTSRSPGGSRRPGKSRPAVRHTARAGSSGESASHVSVSYVSQPTTTAAPSVASTSESSGGSAAVGPSNASAASDRSSSSSASGPVGAGAPFGPGQMTGG